MRAAAELTKALRPSVFPGQRTLARVGVTGFEPAASSSRTTRATKLRHTPAAHLNRRKDYTSARVRVKSLPVPRLPQPLASILSRITGSGVTGFLE